MPDIKTADGITWNYMTEGEGDTLLFIHGWGVDKRIWRQQIKYFSEKYKVVSVDLPGHGRSSWGKVTLEDMVHDLKIVLTDELGKPITIIGSSLGGLVALKFYCWYPTIVKRLVFVGSMPKFSYSEDYSHGLQLQEMRKLNNQLDSNYPSIVNIFFRSLFTKEERTSRRYKWLSRFRRDNAAPKKAALVEYLDILGREDLRENLKHLDIPAQFINGREDKICKKEAVYDMQKLSPSSRFDFFENCGHFPFLSKPHEFNRVLEEFLEETKQG